METSPFDSKLHGIGDDKRVSLLSTSAATNITVQSPTSRHMVSNTRVGCPPRHRRTSQGEPKACADCNTGHRRGCEAPRNSSSTQGKENRPLFSRFRQRYIGP